MMAFWSGYASKAEQVSSGARACSERSSRKAFVERKEDPEPETSSRAEATSRMKFMAARMSPADQPNAMMDSGLGYEVSMTRNDLV